MEATGGSDLEIRCCGDPGYGQGGRMHLLSNFGTALSEIQRKQGQAHWQGSEQMDSEERDGEVGLLLQEAQSRS